MGIGDMKVEIKIQDIDEVRDILNKAKAIIEADQLTEKGLPHVYETPPMPPVKPPKQSKEEHSDDEPHATISGESIEKAIRDDVVAKIREAVSDLNALLGLAANNNIKVVFKEFDVTHIGDATSRTMVDVDLWQNY